MFLTAKLDETRVNYLQLWQEMAFSGVVVKGIVFTEFFALVEQTWGEDMVDDLIDHTGPSSGGAYTSVGTYEFEELQAYVLWLAERTNTPASALIYTFGLFLAGQFVKRFPVFFEQASSLFELLSRIEEHIHVEVRKLYPDAELPHFSHQLEDPKTLVLHYRSRRHLQDLAHGLIQASADYYQTPVEISRTTTSDADTAEETFTIRLL